MSGKNARLICNVAGNIDASFCMTTSALWYSASMNFLRLLLNATMLAWFVWLWL